VAGKVWYETLRSKYMKPNSQFQDAANATIKIADKLYGGSSVERKAIVEGWKSVGITPKV